jgi:hypothetical protein
MTYPFVQAKWYTPGAITEYRALVVHMAEGGGTVGYFTRVLRDVSASHVIEYSGRIVQMVKDGDASHCQHTSPEPYTSENYGIYSSLTGRAVLGADGWANVNRYVFAVEIEGFRATGPNDAQKAALKSLVADLRKRFPSIRGLLGHRDVQDKSCPGALIPWAEIGGHGLFEEAEVKIAFKVEQWTLDGAGKITTLGAPYKADGVTVDYSQRLTYSIAPAELLTLVSRSRLTNPDASQDVALRKALFDYALPVAEPTDCTPLVNAARQEGTEAGLRDGARAVKDAAVNAAVLLGG